MWKRAMQESLHLMEAEHEVSGMADMEEALIFQMIERQARQRMDELMSHKGEVYVPESAVYNTTAATLTENTAFNKTASFQFA